MDITTGIIFGIISMFCFGISNSLLKVPASKINPVKNLFVRGIFMSSIIFIVLLFFLKSTVFDWKYILIALVISFIGGYLPLMSYIKALKHGKVGVVSPIAQSSALFTVLFAIIFYQEMLSFWQIISIIVVILGIFLMSVNLKDFKKSDLLNIKSGILLAIVTCFLWGLGFFLFKIPINVIGPVFTSFLTEFGILIFSIIQLTKRKESFSLPDNDILKLYFIYALFSAAASLTLNFGIKYSNNVSIVSAIVAANPIIIAIYGKIFYKENLKIQQYLALFIIIFGIFVLSFLS